MEILIRRNIIQNHFDFQTCIDFWRANPLKCGLHEHSHLHLQGTDIGFTHHCANEQAY